MKLTELNSYINNLLESESFSDYCPNGLQVEGKPEISKIVTGVSACIELFDRAIEQNADAIITHHGLFWEGQPVTAVGVRRDRIARLLNNNISLLSWHLPLDAHPEHGNNAVIARNLGMVDLQPFGKSRGRTIGFTGTIPPIPFPLFQDMVRKKINPSARFHSFGPETVKRIAICSGGAPSYFPEAIEAGADVYLTGEESEWVYHMAREERVHYITAGHHATERFGVAALGNFLSEKFGLDVQFIDIPNPI